MNIVLTPATISRLELGLDDVVLVKVNDNLTPNAAREIRDKVQEALPGHKILVLARNISIEVIAK